MSKTWRPLVKLTVYCVTVLAATSLLSLVIVNARFAATVEYSAKFTDASGLVSNSDVRIAGVTVGKITAIEVTDAGNAQVRFTVQENEFVPSSVRAVVKYANLIGDRYLSLERTAGAPNEELRPGATIPNERTEPALNLTVLFQGFKPLFQGLRPEQVNQLAGEIVRTLQGQGGTVDQLLAHTASLTNTIADRDRVIGQLIDNLNNVLETVASRDNQLSTLIGRLQQLVTGLARDRDAVGSAIESMSRLSQSVAGLLGEAREPLDKNIEHLGGLARNLAKGSDTIDRVLGNMPELLNEVDRTASYGSWFQFYLCQLEGAIKLPEPLPNRFLAYANQNQRCFQ